VYRPGSRSAWDIGTSCLPGARAAPFDPASRASRSRRRGPPGRGHDRAGPAVRPLRVPSDRSAAAGCGLAGQRQAGRAVVAARGAEGSGTSAEAWSAMAQRRVLRPPAGRTGQPRLVLRLRPSPHPRRPGVPDIERAGRVHSGKPDDPGSTQALVGRCDRCADGSVHSARATGLHPFGQWA
jgi:hypothetical protein